MDERRSALAFINIYPIPLDSDLEALELTLFEAVVSLFPEHDIQVMVGTGEVDIVATDDLAHLETTDDLPPGFST